MRKLLRILLWTLLVCAVVAGGLYAFFDPWTVPGDDAQLAVSIEPTLGVGDVVLVSRVASASDGALVRCTDPDSAGRFVIGRVIGSGNDEISFTGGVLGVNGHTPTASVRCDPPSAHLKNPATGDDADLDCFLEELGGGTHPTLRMEGKMGERDVKATVEPGKVYLISDDRPWHLDSRDFGPVSASTCHAIVARLWGASGWGDPRRRLTMLW